MGIDVSGASVVEVGVVPGVVVVVVDPSGTVVVSDELSHAVASSANATIATRTRTLRLRDVMTLGRLLRRSINL